MKKRALVTGNSRGIGRALAKDGYEVIVHCAGNIAKAEEVVEAIKELGGKAFTIKADVYYKKDVRLINNGFICSSLRCSRC